MVASGAFAQTASGKIEGKVVDAVTQKPLGDVVITATSPGLQGEQTVVSDATGEFEIPTLPPGSYLVHLERENYKPLNQPDIVVRLDKTVRLNLPLVPESLQSQEIVIVGKAPTVDVGSTQTGATITDDFINNIPVAGPNSVGGAVRSFESLQSTAPGAANDDYGVSIAGTTSPENNYTIDGVTVNNPSHGVLGSSLAIDFIKEVDVITGGYMPEYGHATGGVTNVVTKSGGNEFHGSLGAYLQPGFLTAPAKQVVPTGQGLSSNYVNGGVVNLNANLVGEVGGPIIKDKLWFYAGFAPTATLVEIDRTTNVVSYSKGCPVDAAGNPVASSSAPSFASYSINDSTGNAINCPATVRGVATDPTGSPVIASTTPVADSKQVIHNDTLQTQYIAKLTYLLNQDQRFSASVWGNPGYSTGMLFLSQNPVSVNGPYSSYAGRDDFNTNDYSIRWDGSFFDKHMLAEATLGWHHETSTVNPEDPALANEPEYLYGYQPPGLQHSVVEFEPNAAQWCGANDSSQTYQTCPATGYSVGSQYLIQAIKEDSYQAQIAATNLFRAAGHHEVKYGFSFLYERYEDTLSYPGGVEYSELGDLLGDGQDVWIDARRFGYLSSPDNPVFQDSVHNITHSTGLAGYVQDSYRVLDLFTINAGVRWEDQQLVGGTGQTVISLPNNIQPRVGVIYDPTQNGRSKVFANYSLYYEQVPIDLLDREFPPATTIYAFHDCAPGTVPDSKATNCTGLPFGGGTSQTWTESGGTITPVDPNLKGQSTTEISGGGEYEIIPDGRLGLTYTHRTMNSVIEDVSNDNANTYVLANPGEGVASDFTKPTRTYNAGTVYFNKALSHRWMVQASYTLSRLSGNYQGLFIDNGGVSQLDPNITASFDLKQWEVNADGPLPGDHTHNLKAYAAYDLPINGVSDFTLGLSYTALSGSPTNYSGYDNTAFNLYGQPLLFIIPRGAGPRLPWIHDVDASFHYNRKLSDATTLTASVDIFNLLDFRTVTLTDDVYSFSVVNAIPNGTPDDIKNLKTVTGGPAVKNPTFGQPIAYQNPLSVRLGLKLTF